MNIETQIIILEAILNAIKYVGFGYLIASAYKIQKNQEKIIRLLEESKP